MEYLWISPDFIYRLDDWLRTPALRERGQDFFYEVVTSILRPKTYPLAEYPNVTTGFIRIDSESSTDDCEWKATYYGPRKTAMLLDFRWLGQSITSKRIKNIRAILISSDTIKQWASGRDNWNMYCVGLCNVGMIDSERMKSGNFVVSGNVSSIFLPRRNWRLHIYDNRALALSVVLEDIDSVENWETHAASRSIHQPRQVDIED